MGFLLKFLFFLVIVAIGGGFLINQTPSLKQKALEIINPAIKEARILDQLGTKLAELDTTIVEVSNAKNLSEAKIKIKNTGKILGESKELIKEVAEINQDNSGLIGQAVGRIIDALVDKTPFPADHLKTTAGGGVVIPVANGTPVVCPTK